MTSRAAFAVAAAAVAEVLVGGLTDFEDLTAKAEVNTCKVVVEVHLHMLITDFTDDTHNRATVSGLHHQ